MSRRLRTTLALALAASVALSPGASGQRLAGARPDASTDEGGIWAQADRAELQARTSGELDQDEALNDYVRGVACKVVAKYCKDIRLYVMDRPFFNASMAPNGYTEVWSGALLRASSEAELAFIVSHEGTHFTENHSLEALRADRSRRNVLLAVQVGVAVVGAAAAGGAATYQDARAIMDATSNLIDVLYLSSMARYFAFSREQETEADLGGLRKVTAAGYDPQASISLWRRVMAEGPASDFERVRKRPVRTNIFDSHPMAEERIVSLTKVMPADGQKELGRERYRAAIRPHLGAWLRDDMRRKDFGQTLFIIDNLARDGEDLGVLNYYRAECYRLRGKGDDQAAAAKAYRAATEHADAPAAAWRDLGEILRKQKDEAGARAAYQTYLEKAPKADDAWLISEELDALK